MRRFYARLGVLLLYLVSIGSLLFGGTSLASVISSADFFGTIQVTNNGTAETFQSSNITNISITSLINGGFIPAASNTTLAVRTPSGEDVAFQPGYGTNTWMTWVPAIGANTAFNYVLYTSGNSTITGGSIRYFPGSGGMTAIDAAGLEMANNFTIEQRGYIDTTDGADKNLVYKQNAFRIYILAGGTIRAAILGAGDAETVSVDAVAVGSDVHTVAVTVEVR